MTASVSPAETAAPSRIGQRGHHAGLVGGDLVLHLHRLDDADERALLDRGALLDEHLEDVALERRGERVARRAAGAAAPAAAAAGARARRGRAAVGRSRRPARRARGRRTACPTPPPCRCAPAARPPPPRAPGGRGRPAPASHSRVLDEVAARLAARPLRRGHDRAVEGQQRRDALDLELVQRPRHASRRGGAVGVPDDQLGHHRVVERRDLASPPRRPSRRARPARPARGSAAIVPGAGAKPRAASSALMRHSIACPRSATSSWRDGQRLAGGDADLLAHDVDAGRRPP